MASAALPPLMPSAAMRWDIVASSLPASPGRVLEIGCGQGAVAARLASRALHFVGIEPDATSFAVAKARVGEAGQVFNMQASELPADAQFDLVCAFEVIEHIEDDSAALANWVSRLKPGGRILLSVPAHRSRFGAADELAGHFRRYDPADMQSLLEDAGLEDIRLQLYGHGCGQLLEAARNTLARRQQSSGKAVADIEERTATSGRLFQPHSKWQSLGLGLLGQFAVRTQRLFPGRGVGIVASGRKKR